MPRQMLSRRRLLLSAALTGAATASRRVAAEPIPVSPQTSPVLRVAFFTDAHVPVDKEDLTKKPQNTRVVRAFQKMAAEKPDFVVFGGDNVMAVDQGNTREHADAQFANWKTLVKEYVKAPTVSVIGNHDIWYPKGEEPKDRKALAVEAYGMPKRYYALTKGDWKFLMLDTFHADGCHIDSEQWDWLKQEIADKTKNVVLVSHASILTISTFIERGKPDKGAWSVPVGWMVGNATELRELFLQHPNVRLSLSGHMHHIDRVDYDAVTYLCGGAVSGSWWSGDYFHFAPAFVMLDLHSDGTFRHRIVFWEKS